MTKYYVNGKRYNTPYQIIKEKLVKLIKLCSWIVVLTSLVVGIAIVGRIINPKIEYKQVEKEIILDNLTAKVNELKGQLISELKQCESAGYSEDFGLVTFDAHPTNKKVQPASYGSFQYKKSTVQYYYKKLYNKDVTGKEAILIALDDQKASALTSDVIFKDGALSNWFNCSKKLNLQTKLDTINMLLK